MINDFYKEELTKQFSELIRNTAKLIEVMKSSGKDCNADYAMYLSARLTATNNYVKKQTKGVIKDDMS